MKCAEVMSRDIVFALPSETLDRAAKKMEAEDIGSLPVVDDSDGQKLIGMLTDRDITVRAVAKGLDPRSTRVEQVMSGDVVTCRGEDDLESAMEAMGSNQVRRLPVVDEEERLVGIIAQADIATRFQQPDKVAEVVEDISQPGV